MHTVTVRLQLPQYRQLPGHQITHRRPAHPEIHHAHRPPGALPDQCRELADVAALGCAGTVALGQRIT